MAGLALGLSCCLVVFAIIDYEFNFDDWHEKGDRIYRFTGIYHGDNRTSYNGISPYAFGRVLKEEIPELEKVVEFHGPMDEKLSFTDEKGEFKIFREENVLMTNEAFFDVLDFELLSGSKEALNQPNQIYLTESLSKKYFPEGDAIGKTVTFNNETNLTVAGIVEDCPDNTNLPFSCLISIATLRQTEPKIWNNWGMTWAYTLYVLTKPDADIISLNAKIDDVIDGYTADDEEDAAKTEVALQPLNEIHNDERYGDGYNYVTPSVMIWAFIFLGTLILGTACLNFINLSTAQATKRSKEVGIRKTLGGSQKELVFQFLTETLFIISLSMMLAFSTGQFLLEGFNQMLSSIDYNLQFSNSVVAFAVVLAIVVTTFAGFYPSIILSGFQPAEVLKNKVSLKKGSGSFVIRKWLVILQFTFTTIMLIGALIISAQVNFMKNKDLGFNTNGVVSITTPEESEVDPEKLLAEFQSKSYVEDATLAFSSPLDGSNWNHSYKVKGERYIDGNNANMKFVDDRYLDFFDIKLLAGNNITELWLSDTLYNVIVTKHLLKTLSWNDPQEAVGQTLTSGGGRLHYHIVGVVEDFNVASPHKKIRPVMLMYRPELMNKISLRLSSNNSEYVKNLETTFRKYYPNDLFEFEVLANEISDFYRIEDVLHNVIRFVSFLAVLLSVMGLFGLVSFMANREAKVIGIRKVFGATTTNILGLFTKEYLKLMFFAFLFAGPVAYYLMSIWIQEFAFRINLSPLYFVGGFLITLIIAVLTVGYRSFMAAQANPVDSLRYE